MTNETAEQRKLLQEQQNLIEKFCELYRLGLIDEDWSEFASTGIVEVKTKVANDP
jgi:hypothetical protein